MREYTELLVECRRLLTQIEDSMLNDRDVPTSLGVTKHQLIPAACELMCILSAQDATKSSLTQPYWTPRTVDADTTSPPLSEH